MDIALSKDSRLEPKVYTKQDHSIDQSLIDPDALFVVEQLKKAGFTAYIVGGCVRDLLLGHVPKDYDISTSALPEEIKPLFNHCILIGRRFRLAHVRFGRKVMEVSTFRMGDNEDDALIVRDNEWGSEEEDVTRRDFTINGLFYDPTEETITDYVKGLQDIKKQTLRTIGNAHIRFKQDPVRMIRLIKFRARFGLNVDPEAVKALFDCREEILKSAPPRVLEEVLRMLESGSSLRFFKLLSEHGILSILAPKLSQVFEHDLRSDIFDYLAEIDSQIKTSKKKHIPRAILLSGILYPIFRRHIHTLTDGRDKPPHLGEIQNEATFIIHDTFAPFLKITKKISANIVSILTSQFRFTPLEKKKRVRYRIPNVPDFNNALDFLLLRASLEPGLAKLYEEWNFYWQKHQKWKKRRSK